MDNRRAGDPLLADLNEPQRRAVIHRDGPLLVLAGPGSGKTRVITRRAAFLVRQGVPPWAILAITFTNKAAGEMRERIAAAGVGQGMWVYTFHALGARLLHQFGSLAGVGPNFSIYDDSDQISVIKEAFAAAEVTETMLRPETAQAAISHAKNKLETPEQFAQRADFFENRTIARVYAEYQRLLGERNAVDFDDLLMKVALLVRDNADVARRLNDRFHYLLIDEYQDTNHAQYVIARGLSQHHRNVCATGDPDQSIYGWRGADLNNILEFERDYPDAVVVRLEQNYRSTGAILRAASRLIKANKRRKHKELWTENGEGEPVRLLEFGDGEEEAQYVARAIADIRRRGRPYSDVAIFYRVNAISRGLEQALRDAGIPYKIARGLEFYNRREIRDVIAYLRVLANPDDQQALVRIINTPPRGIGKVTIDRLTAAAESAGWPLMTTLRRAGELPEIKPATAGKIAAFVRSLDATRAFLDGKTAAAISAVLELSGLEKAIKEESERGGEEEVDRWANVQELISGAVRFDEQYEAGIVADAASAPRPSPDESAAAIRTPTGRDGSGANDATPFDDFFEQGGAGARESDAAWARRPDATGATDAGAADGEPPDAPPPRLVAFLRQVALVNDQDAVDESAGVVMLMTLHAAKGLEFPIVFLVGLEQGLLPHERALRAGLDVEEERRLCFVGITRARELLHLTRADRRLVAGVYAGRAPSEFLRELPVDEMKCVRLADSATRGVGRFAEDDSGASRYDGDEYAGGGAGGVGRRRDGGGEVVRGDGRQYVPMHDHDAPGAPRGWRRGPMGGGGHGGRVAGADRAGRGDRGAPTGRTGEPADDRPMEKALSSNNGSRFADWSAGLLVEHAKYGPGQIVWIRPSAGQTRAAIRFPRVGEKTFILDVAPVRKLAKKP